jgi:hypothetical protein
MRQHPWDESKYYTPKEAGAFFGRGDDWARDRFRNDPDTIHDRSSKANRRVRKDYDSLLIMGSGLTRFRNRRIAA